MLSERSTWMVADEGVPSRIESEVSDTSTVTGGASNTSRSQPNSSLDHKGAFIKMEAFGIRSAAGVVADITMNVPSPHLATDNFGSRVSKRLTSAGVPTQKQSKI